MAANCHGQCSCGRVLAAELTLPTDQGTTTAQSTCDCSLVYDWAIEHLEGAGEGARYEYRVRKRDAMKAAFSTPPA